MTSPEDDLTLTTDATASPRTGSILSHVGGFPWLAGCVIAVIVLASVCALAAAIYAYIYFTRIKARPGGSSSVGHGGRTRHHELQSAHDSSSAGGGSDRQVHTHIFMFKKSWLPSALRVHRLLLWYRIVSFGIRIFADNRNRILRITLNSQSRSRLCVSFDPAGVYFCTTRSVLHAELNSGHIIIVPPPSCSLYPKHSRSRRLPYRHLYLNKKTAFTFGRIIRSGVKRSPSAGRKYIHELTGVHIYTVAIRRTKKQRNKDNIAASWLLLRKCFFVFFIHNGVRWSLCDCSANVLHQQQLDACNSSRRSSICKTAAGKNHRWRYQIAPWQNKHVCINLLFMVLDVTTLWRVIEHIMHDNAHPLNPRESYIGRKGMGVCLYSIYGSYIFLVSSFCVCQLYL